MSASALPSTMPSRRKSNAANGRLTAQAVLARVMDDENSGEETEDIVSQAIGKGKKNNKEDIVASKVAEILLPQLTTAIDEIVERRVSRVLERVSNLIEKELNAAFDKVERNSLLLKYELDRQEQYSRRETVKITGLPEEEGEDIEDKVLKLCTKMGCEVKREDISAVHRSGQKQVGENAGGRHRTNRPVLVKFVSRKNKASVMKNKKNLKDITDAALKNVYVNDDLTPLRSKLLHKAKTTPGVERVNSTHDGRLVCTMRKGPGETTAKTVVIETPDDLFKLGVNDVDYSAFGLGHLVLTDE